MSNYYAIVYDNSLNVETATYSNLDINWVQFVNDHLPQLKTEAKIYTPTGEQMSPLSGYHQSVKRFMVNVLGIDPNGWWIFLKLNNLTRGEIDFTYDRVKRGVYYVDNATLDALYEKYHNTSTDRITNPIGGFIGVVPSV